MKFKIHYPERSRGWTPRQGRATIDRAVVFYAAVETYPGDDGPAGRHQVNQQDQQAIDELFQHLYKSAAQAGPRDPEAEALIQKQFKQAPPGLLYHLAQTLV